jgi:hypothetical protein
VLEALKVAKQQRIISSTLDPLYVQQKAVQVYRTLAHSSNKVIMHAAELARRDRHAAVLSGGKRKILTPADEKLLEDMEHALHEGGAPAVAVDRPDAPSDPAAARPAGSEPAHPGPAAPAPTRPPPA